MIPLPQEDIEDTQYLNSKQKFISSSEDEEEKEKERISSQKLIFKYLLIVAIVVILIISYLPNRKKQDKLIDNIPQEKDNINKQNQNIKENESNKNNLDNNKEKDNNERIKQKEKEKEKTEVKKEKEKTEDDKKKENKEEKKEKPKETEKVNDSEETKTDNSKEEIYNYDLSIIIISFNKNNDLNSLIKNILSKNIENCEIIINTQSYFNNDFLNKEKDLQKRNIKLRYVIYGEKTKRFKLKIDSALNTKGKYIVFIDPEQALSLEIFDNYKNYIKDDIDIIQYDLNYDRIGENYIVRQPQLYESLFFGGRDSFDFNHFHVNGKLYKKEIFVSATNNLDKLYLEQSDKYFDEIMIIILVFQKANTFKKLKQRNSCNRDKCQKQQYSRYNYNQEVLKDVVLFVRFFFECTGKDKVQEKRYAARIFNELLISKRVRSFYNNDLLKLIQDTIDLYLNSDLINDMDKSPIERYKRDIKV